MKRTEILDRIRLRCVVTPSGCWIWQGAMTGGNQYHVPRRPRPEMRLNGKVVYVARVVLAETLGRPIADGCHAAHVNGCRKNNCVSPFHLAEHTAEENAREANDYQWGKKRNR